MRLPDSCSRGSVLQQSLKLFGHSCQSAKNQIFLDSLAFLAQSIQLLALSCIYTITAMLSPVGHVIEPRVLWAVCTERCLISATVLSGCGITTQICHPPCFWHMSNCHYVQSRMRWNVKSIVMSRFPHLRNLCWSSHVLLLLSHHLKGWCGSHQCCPHTE